MTNDEKRDAILLVISSIPKGQVATYGSVAEMASLKGHARFVGSILKNLPSGSTIPWFRVINSQGKISFPENGEKFCEQKNRLESEGILFKNNKINLKKYLWIGN
ncbi:MGMT family protein [Pseudoalteromonas sp. SSM20]|uniref:MGMT family protein n=1 Tax=Pseudoalteromonas sp. SSM20 TaxID=3139394 RepID=UPI003BAD1E27